MGFSAKAAFQSAKDSPNLCSTARILLYLCKLYYAVSSLDDNNPTVRQAAMLYIREAHISNALENLTSQLLQIKATILNLFNPLENASPQAKQTFNAKKPEVEQYSTKVESHNSKSGILRDSNASERKKVLDSVGDAMIKTAESSDPKAAAKDPTIQGILSTAQKSQDERRKELARIARETVILEEQGNALGVELHAKSPVLIQDPSKLTEEMRKQAAITSRRGG